MKLPGRLAAVTFASAAVVYVALLAMGAVASPQDDTYSSTQATMRGVFLTLSKAYKYSLDPEAFESPTNRNEIHNTLEALVKNADALESHIGELDPSFDYLKRSLARDANEALSRFESGQYMGSRWALNKITENCVTCHSKLPAEKQTALTKGFLSDQEIKTLDPLAHAELALALRQFDQAMGEYEAVFTDRNMSPRDIMMTNALENYLRVAAGVRGETERAIRALSQFAAREDVSDATRTLIRGWLKQLGSFDTKVESGKELATAREVIDKARASTRFPKDRSQQVTFIEAASILHKYLQTKPSSNVDVAEALYLLGVAESYISRSYWISETDHLLEQAIRKAPGAPVAKEAYAFLEEYMMAGYSVTARKIPEGESKRLEELRELIANANG